MYVHTSQKSETKLKASTYISFNDTYTLKMYVQLMYTPQDTRLGFETRGGIFYVEPAHSHID